MYSRSSEPVRFERDCAAVLVPQGDEVTLPAGTVGYITQSLGGSWTVFVEGNLMRIAGKQRTTLDLEYENDTPLFETERDIALAPWVAQAGPEGSRRKPRPGSGHCPVPLRFRCGSLRPCQAQQALAAFARGMVIAGSVGAGDGDRGGFAAGL